MMISRRLLVLCVSLAWGASAWAEFRIWTGNNGVSLDADLVRQTDSSVLLRRRDGPLVTIAKTNLSAADLEYLKSLNPAGSVIVLGDPAWQVRMRESMLRKGLVFEDTAPPLVLTLKRVPMVKQFGRYCVPASAEMIAVYHKIRVNQTQIARFSSRDSKNHRGTNPDDMANAMENLGFIYETRQWSWEPRNHRREPIPDEVRNDILPLIYKAIASCGPLYTSFKAGVFGEGAHGCVLIGYDQKKEELYFHNPWGNTFTKSFAEFAAEAYQVVAFQLPPQIAGDGRSLADSLAKAMPAPPAGLAPMQFVELLQKQNIPAHIQLSARRDQQHQRGGTQAWGVSQGYRIINAAMRTHLVVLMPSADQKGAIKEWILLYRDPEGDRMQLWTRRSSPAGWQKEQPAWPSDLTSDWAVMTGSGRWDLPMILIGAPPEATDGITGDSGL